MKTITIQIIKKSVMGVVEGLSATIAQHNPEVDFETIWASDAEEAKLDIYYREAITDLENFLASFSSSTTQQFDLQALADDFTITVKTLAYWPPRLSGVLTNQIQNYLVHAIMAGWLSDFPDMPHTDYASMGASDLESIKEVLLKKDFSFAEAARKEDSTQKTVSSSNTLARQVDETVKQTDALVSASRALDASSKELNATHTEIRSSDTQEKAGKGLYADSRQADDEGKQQNDLSAEARNGDDDEKDGQRGVKTSERNPDFMSQHFHQDYTDWSGGRPPFVLR